jgi:predicted phosphohydrolase
MTPTIIPGKLRIVCISDTHNDDPSAKVPDGDILLHAGDMTDDGTLEELETTLSWIRKLPHKKKVIIAGRFKDRFTTNSAHPGAL